MRRRVVGIAVQGAVVDRHGSVLRNRQDEEQLWEVRSVIFIVSVGHHDGRLSPYWLSVGGPVRPRESQRRRIVVQFIQRDLKLPDGLQYQFGEERRSVGVKESIKTPPHTLVVEPGRFCFRESQ